MSELFDFVIFTYLGYLKLQAEIPILIGNDVIL